MKKIALLTLPIIYSWALVAQNVGIGTNAPASKLDVNGGLTVGATYSGTNSAPANGAIIEGNVGIGTSTPSFKLHIGAENGDGIMIGKFNDQLGWNGSSPAPELAIRFAGFRDVISNFTGAKIAAIRTNLCCGGASQGTELSFSTQEVTATQSADGNLVERMRIGNGGNVGIGISAPAHKLDVAGDINVSSGQGYLINGAAPSGQYLRGNGTRFVSSSIQAGDIPTLNQNTTGQAGSVAQSITFNNSGTGSASGSSFNGGSALTISYNTIGAAPLSGSGNYIQNQTSADQAASFRINGIADINGGNPFAVPNGYMSSGSMTIGDINKSFGGGNGWTSNTAGLFLETQANTEIAVHDYNNRLASLLYYQGDNTNQLTIGRDMGWGGIGRTNFAGDNYAYFGPNSNWGAYLQVGGNGRVTTDASVTATNGNLHLDSKDGGINAIYLNFYSQDNTYINPQGGNVGIGLTTPNYKLDVNGSFRTANGFLTLFNDYIYVSPTNNNTLNSGYYSNNSADMWVNYRGYQDGFTQSRNFNVGDGKGGNIAWFDGTNHRMSINNGQTANYTLDVNGNVRASALAGTGNRMVLADANGNLVTNTTVTKADVLYIRGTGLNHGGERILRIGNSEIYNTASGRGLRLTVINKSDHSVASDVTYDCFGNATASDDLATALNAINYGQIGILTSYDAWEGQITTSLQSAFQRLGLFKALNTTVGSSRRPYAAIFEASNSTVASAKAVEVEYSPDANEPYAEIRGWLIDGSFVATGGVPSGLATPIGANAVNVDESGNVGIGATPSASYKLYVNGRIKTNGINETSDARLKTNVTTIPNALQDVLRMRGVTYDWDIKNHPDMKFDTTLQYGLIAQELEKIIPQLVGTDKEGWKSIEYSHLVPVLVEAIKAQQNIIDKQQQENTKMKASLTNAQSDITQLKQSVKTLEYYIKTADSK